MTTACINRIATAVPTYDMHHGFIAFAETLLSDGTPRNLFRRMVRQSAIDHRYSCLNPVVTADGEVSDADAFFV
ncbi:MAG: type III polyketide synthase, partial [Terracidiphilus sp.]